MDEDDDDFEERPRRRKRRPREDDDEFEDEDDYDERLPRAVLRDIATYQKAILMCILIYFGLVATQFVIPPENRLFLLIGAVPLAIASTVFVFLLATKVYSTGTGVVLGILTLIPCIGLIVLLIINGKATTILKSNGIAVGLLGARMSDI